MIEVACLTWRDGRRDGRVWYYGPLYIEVYENMIDHQSEIKAWKKSGLNRALFT